MLNTKMYSRETKGSCPFKIRPKLLFIIYKRLFPGKILPKKLHLKRQHNVLEKSNIADIHIK